MKAALASALAYHPKLIVLDEPFTGLDPLVRDELIKVCWSEQKNRQFWFRRMTWPRSKASQAMWDISSKGGCGFPRNSRCWWNGFGKCR